VDRVAIARPFEYVRDAPFRQRRGALCEQPEYVASETAACEFGSMDSDTPTPGAMLLDLCRHFLETIRRCLGQLTQLTQPLLTDRSAFLSYEAMRLGDRLDEAVYSASHQAFSLIRELKSWDRGLSPDDRRVISELAAEFDTLTERWKALMEGVDHVWKRGNSPQ
jgi:hypothetical protein